MRFTTKTNAALMLGCSALGWSLLAPNPVRAVTVGAATPVNYTPVVVSSFCNITESNGALGFIQNAKTITSDINEIGNYSAGRSAASFSVASNLVTGTVIIDAPLLTGPTAANTSELRIGSGTYSASAVTAPLDANGALASTTVNVKFTTAATSKFANGTYGATATLTCTDNGNK